MNKFLNKFYFLKSRKFWAAFGSWLIILATAIAEWQSAGIFPYVDFTTKTVAIWTVYMGTVAFEDGMEKRNSK